VRVLKLSPLIVTNAVGQVLSSRCLSCENNDLLGVCFPSGRPIGSGDRDRGFFVALSIYKVYFINIRGQKLKVGAADYVQMGVFGVQSKGEAGQSRQGVDLESLPGLVIDVEHLDVCLN
jgi:hypothetical protein